MACKFCEDYKWHKDYDKKHPIEDGMNTIYKVRLVQEHYKDRQHRGTLTGKPHKLKYCPVCGKKLI